MREGKRQYTVFLPEEMAVKLEEMVKDQYLPVSTYIRMVLAKHIKEASSQTEDIAHATQMDAR